MSNPEQNPRLQVARVLALVVTPCLRAMVPCHADVVRIREVLLQVARDLALDSASFEPSEDHCS